MVVTHRPVRDESSHGVQHLRREIEADDLEVRHIDAACEGDLMAIGRPDGPGLGERALRQAHRWGITVNLLYIDMRLIFTVRNHGDRQPSAIGGPCGVGRVPGEEIDRTQRIEGGGVDMRLSPPYPRVRETCQRHYSKDGGN